MLELLYCTLNNHIIILVKIMLQKKRRQLNIYKYLLLQLLILIYFHMCSFYKAVFRFLYILILLHSSTEVFSSVCYIAGNVFFPGMWLIYWCQKFKLQRCDASGEYCVWQWERHVHMYYRILYFVFWIFNILYLSEWF